MRSGLNLLHYPTLDRQQRLRRQVREGGLGAAAGAVIAGATLCAVSWQTDSLHAQKKSLQAQLDERQSRVLVRQQRQAQNQEIHQVLVLLSQLQSHQLAWTQLQNGLQDVLPQHGHRLQRLHVEGGRIEVQGQASDAQSITRALQPLSERWGVPLVLQSLEADGSSAQGVSFAWQAQWPTLSDHALVNRGKP
jgi:Tfp pilus assembly protein PilN